MVLLYMKTMSMAAVQGGNKKNRSINNYETKEMMDSQLHGMHAVVVQRAMVMVSMVPFHDCCHFQVSPETFSDDR